MRASIWEENFEELRVVFRERGLSLSLSLSARPHHCFLVFYFIFCFRSGVVLICLSFNSVWSCVNPNRTDIGGEFWEKSIFPNYWGYFNTSTKIITLKYKLVYNILYNWSIDFVKKILRIEKILTAFLIFEKIFLTFVVVDWRL